MAYKRRTIDSELDQLLPQLPAIALEGPKGVGKTTTALQHAGTVFDLDLDPQKAVVAGDPSLITSASPPVFIDEWQRYPQIWDVVRRAVDADRTPGRFLLAGSAVPAADSHHHSGAGRIVSLRLRPMTLEERGCAQPTVSLAELLAGKHPAIAGDSPMALTDYVNEILASGFPGIRQDAPLAREIQLDSYLERIVDRDFPMLGHTVRRPQVLRGWLAAYAAATATTASYQQILIAATPPEADRPAKTTTIAYRDLLTRMFLLDPIPGWSSSKNPMARLRQTPKHHLADPALAARLLGASADSLLGGQSGVLTGDGALLGTLFESLAALCVRVAAQPARARVAHLRTQDDAHEVDLIVERADGAVVAIEVKLASAINSADLVHLRWLKEQLGPRLIDSMVLTTGPTAYRRQDGVAVVPLALLGA